VSVPDRRIAAGLFVLAAVTFGWFYGGAGWNQDAHFDLARALVERRTLHIDGYESNTGDISHGVNGHTFINKAPGVSFLAAVPYAAVVAVKNARGVPIDATTRADRWIVSWLICGVCGACIGPVLYLYGRRRMAATPLAALCVTLCIAFGTIVFPYSTMLFAHVPSALFLLLAVTRLKEHPAAAGIAAGLAACCFYVCAAAAVILAVIALTISRRSALCFACGAGPFAVLLGIYQWLCFGSPFRTAVEASTSFTENGLLFGVLRMPRMDALYGLSFSPYRGLFFASPVLLFALIGLGVMRRRSELYAIASIAVTFFIVIAAFNGWNGGCAFGPRYLLPIIPLLGIPMFAAASLSSRIFRLTWIAAAVTSVFFSFVATATDPMPCSDVPHPISRYLMPAFFTGRIPEKTRRAFPWYPTVDVDKIELPRESGNLGEFVLGRRKRASLMPIVLWLAGGTALLLRTARNQPQRLLIE
jgi:hypothetical protein